MELIFLLLVIFGGLATVGFSLFIIAIRFLEQRQARAKAERESE